MPGEQAADPQARVELSAANRHVRCVLPRRPPIGNADIFGLSLTLRLRPKIARGPRNYKSTCNGPNVMRTSVRLQYCRGMTVELRRRIFRHYANTGSPPELPRETLEELAAKHAVVLDDTGGIAFANPFA